MIPQIHLHPDGDKKQQEIIRLRERAKSSAGGNTTSQAETIKNSVIDILYDVIHSGDVKSGVQSLKNNKLIDGIEFSKRALIFGIERQAFERELISKLLSASYEIFNGGEIYDGFQLLLFRLPDLTLDVPHAPQILSKFIVRAIYDEIVAPKFIKEAHIDNKQAKECIALAYAMNNSVEDKARMEHIWGPADLTSVADLKSSVNSFLEEFLDNPDINQTTKEFIELNVPSFYGYIIFSGLYKCLGRNSQQITDSFLNLLESWFKINLITKGHLKRGFALTFLRLNDIKLDVPHAETSLMNITNAAIQKKLLPKTFVPILNK